MTHETIAVELKMRHHPLRDKLLPFILTVIIFSADQLTKNLVVKTIPLYTIGASFFGDLIRIIYVNNFGAAFSMGATMSETFRHIFLAFIPLIVLIVVVVIYFRTAGFTQLQRWALCGVLGGGMGNLFDRFFRVNGVVDFIDIKFFGLFGLERFPTFNIADSSVVVCGFIILVSFFISAKKSGEK
ncbi:MAG: signal peptidase II [Treponema sp.]|jgi:signal peptidase II|nr:signal peptidase II [Treponema sp.]